MTKPAISSNTMSTSNDSQPATTGGKKKKAPGRTVKTRRAAPWHRRFEELRVFYRREKHSDVPSYFPENPGLSRWVKHQRWEYALYLAGDRSGRAMTPDRIVRLMVLNFTWNLHERSWCEAYSALLDFKEKNGHTDVPSDFEDRRLVHWVRHQKFQIRRFYTDRSKSRITPDRVQRLYDIGFSCDFSDMSGNAKPICNSSMYPAQHAANKSTWSGDGGVSYLFTEKGEDPNENKNRNEKDDTTHIVSTQEGNEKTLRLSEILNLTDFEEDDGKDGRDKSILLNHQGCEKTPVCASTQQIEDDGDGDNDYYSQHLAAV